MVNEMQYPTSRDVVSEMTATQKAAVLQMYKQQVANQSGGQFGGDVRLFCYLGMTRNYVQICLF